MIETIVFLFISDIFEKILIPFSITDFDYYFINYKNYQRFDYNLLNQKVAYSALVLFQSYNSSIKTVYDIIYYFCNLV